MSEMPALAVTGFGLRIVPFTGQPFRSFHDGAGLRVEVEHPEGVRAATIAPASDRVAAASSLAGIASVEPGSSACEWWVETSTYRMPLPSSWILYAPAPSAGAPAFELLGPGGASISVRTPRRMPSIESFQGPDHVFRDIGQLERAGWIEFEHTEGTRTWLYRHEQLHRGTAPFIVTLKADRDQAEAHMAALVQIVEQIALI